jgi:hypothetical protein
MRISEERYDRDRLRVEVAMRFIRHEARTSTIRQWTGLSDDRIRKLYHSYLQDGGCATRHRGKSPRQVAYFLRTTRIRDEASALASLCALAGVFDEHRPRAMTTAATDVERGASLCRAYDGYCATLRRPLISFEHAALLANALTRGNEVRLGACEACGVLLVVESLGLRPTRCSMCSTHGVAPQPFVPLALARRNRAHSTSG